MRGDCRGCGFPLGAEGNEHIATTAANDRAAVREKGSGLSDPKVWSAILGAVGVTILAIAGVWAVMLLNLQRSSTRVNGTVVGSRIEYTVSGSSRSISHSGDLTSGETVPLLVSTKNPENARQATGLFNGPKGFSAVGIILIAICLTLNPDAYGGSTPLLLRLGKRR